ncbi:MAG: TonB-dependent receptor domain-containing protein, partial [bacterium]
MLEPVATRLDAVQITAADSGADRSRSAGSTTITAALLDRMPAANRDLYDLMRFVPEISTKIALSSPGFSAAGAGFRANNFLIGGVSERTLAGGVSSAFGGTRSVPLAAVQEYQVLVSPFDVRYGDFAGALVNAVTKAGTNTFHASAFAYGRNDRFARRQSGDSSTSFDRLQYGASFSGPIVRDRLQFLVASELQQYTYPAAGPYVGQPSGAERPVPVSTVDLGRFDAIMRSHGLTAGSPGAVENRTPLRNLFTRFDLALPAWASRLVAWDNYGSENQVAFSRSSRDTFSLSSALATTAAQAHMIAVQLHTALSRVGGGDNEVLVSSRSEYSAVVGALRQPIVRVSVPSATGGQIVLNSGTPEMAQAGTFRSNDLTLQDNVALPFGANHVLAVGTEAERFRFRRFIGAESYGTWNFASLDDFAAGRAQRYDVGIDFGTNTAAVVGTQYAGYVQDQWRVTNRLSVTAGIRADLLAFDSHAPYNPLVDSIFGRRTDDMPRSRVELSPRVGFVLDSSTTSRQRLRGGIGVFAGRYPLGWAHLALLRYGVGNATLTCRASGGVLQSPPAFTPSPVPTTCAGGTSSTPNLQSDVDLLDRNLRLARVARGSLAYELRTPGNLELTTEALVSRGLSDFAFENLNLNAPLGRDRYGRVLYDAIQTSGQVNSTRRSGFREVIDLVNVSGSHSYQLTTKLERARRAGVSGSASYTYSRGWDAQTPTRVNPTGTVAWATARVLSGRDDEMTVTTSSDDIRHRVIVVGNLEAPWRGARTELSLYYVGESG